MWCVCFFVVFYLVHLFYMYTTSFVSIIIYKIRYRFYIVSHHKTAYPRAFHRIIYNIHMFAIFIYSV